MTPPRIGVTGVVRTEGATDRTGVNVAYVRAVLRAGGLPLILSPLLGADHETALLGLLDGLLLTGGEDVDPAHYGQEPIPDLAPVDPRRDALELSLFRAAWNRGA